MSMLNKDEMFQEAVLSFLPCKDMIFSDMSKFCSVLL